MAVGVVEAVEVELSRLTCDDVKRGQFRLDLRNTQVFSFQNVYISSI